MLLLATPAATVHTGGFNGVSEALARLLGGVAQGCLASAMVFGVVAEMRIFSHSSRCPCVGGPVGVYG